MTAGRAKIQGASGSAVARTVLIVIGRLEALGEETMNVPGPVQDPEDLDPALRWAGRRRGTS